MTEAPTGRMPDFLLIGGMKCGSTTLHDYLVNHPKLAEPQYKEPGFFSRDERFSLGLDWYRSVFASAQEGQLAFESSTCYTRHPHFGEVAPRIHEHLPDIKLVYIMRHPVDRLYSHYRHAMLERHKKNAGPVVSLEAALSEDSEYFDAGCYLRQIREFTAHYDRDRFFFLTLEQLKAEPDPTLGRLQEFLGVEPVPSLSTSLKGASNAASARAMGTTTASARDKLRRNPLVRVAKRLVPKQARGLLMKAVMNSPIVKARAKAKADAFAAQLSSLSDPKRRELLGMYEQPNAALADFLGRPLPASWQA
ncbi:MAG: sulfotransferase domain-containing protein [Nannocystaceae bacterium]|nr:sulfotransferase domain-containing protein [Nannocystaceae bacterium]